MKIKRLSILLLAVLLCCGIGYAKNTKAKGYPVSHLVAWGTLGCDYLDNYIEPAHALPHVGLGLGVGYECHPLQNEFYLQVGAELNYLKSNMSYPNFYFDADVIDTEGEQCVMHYAITDVMEAHNQIAVELPLMVGAEFRSGFYLLGGGKIGGNVLTSARNTCKINTVANYEGLIGDDWHGQFANIPDHYLTIVPYDESNQLGVRFRGTLSCEIGWNIWAKSYLDYKHNSGLRIGAFVNYTFLPVGNTNTNFSLIIDDNTKDGYRPHVATYLFHNAGNFVGDLYAGIKITWTMPFNKMPCCW